MNASRSAPDADHPLLSRRALFGAGGLVSLGMLAAACGGDSGSDAPGRVGNAPPPTPLPAEDAPDDALYLRTAASFEYTIIGLYGDLRALDALSADLDPTLDEFVRRHQDNADELNELVESIGGEAWTCANPWLVERFTGPIVELITNGRDDVEDPSDDPTRDVFNSLTAFENLAGATYQQMVAQLSATDLRQVAAELAGASVRRGAFLAYTATPTPESYFDPEISGALHEESGDEDDEEAEEAAAPIEKMYAMSTPFGDLAAINLTVGAPNPDGARQSFMLETPADNSYIYDDSACPPADA